MRRPCISRNTSVRRPCISRNTVARRPCISRNTAARRPDLTTVQAGSGCVHFGPYDSIYIRPLVAVYGRIRPARTRPRLRLGLVLASRIHPYTAPRGLIYNTYNLSYRFEASYSPIDYTKSPKLGGTSVESVSAQCTLHQQAQGGGRLPVPAVHEYGTRVRFDRRVNVYLAVPYCTHENTSTVRYVVLVPIRRLRAV